MPALATLHPAIQRAVARHREFFAGTRPYLLKISLPDSGEGLAEPPAFDTLDWERDFDAYVRCHVDNGKIIARRRLDLDIDDDTLPYYHPYFGISIHHAFFGGTVSFGGGTSYVTPVIDRAADWRRLRPDPRNPWLQRLARGLAYGRDHGDGVLPASFRGADGPLDMANGVMGDVVFTELYDDPDNMRRVLDICRDAMLLTFDVQRRHCSEIAGGHICPGGVWLPAGVVGHVSVDASCLINPDMYDAFEQPCLEQVTARTGGVFVHTHMLGRRVFRNICRTNGVLVFAPVDDPGQPAMLDELDGILDAIGDTPLMLGLRRDTLAETLPKFHGRRAIFTIGAADRDDALAVMDEVNRYCPLSR